MYGPPQQRRSDRELVIGHTGSGKSVWCRHHFAQIASQKICIDVNDAESFDGVDKIRGRPEKLDWSKPVLHYVPSDPYDQSEYDKVYRQIFARRNVAVWLDESYGPTTAYKVPVALNLVLTQGRKRDQRHMAATQRPVHIARNLIAQADHVVIFPRALSPHDLEWVGKEIGVTRDEMDRAVRVALDPKMGEYGHLHYERRRSIMHARPSIPVRA